MMARRLRPEPGQVEFMRESVEDAAAGRRPRFCAGRSRKPSELPPSNKPGEGPRPGRPASETIRPGEK